MGVAATGVVAGLGVISGSVNNILTSDDKVQIAKYQAEGEVAKANAIIAAAQAKAEADAQAAAEKSKNQKTYIIIGVAAFVLFILLIVLLSTRKTPVQVIPSYQYNVPKPIMPNVQSASSPRQLQSIA